MRDECPFNIFAHQIYMMYKIIIIFLTSIITLEINLLFSKILRNYNGVIFLIIILRAWM